MKKPTAKSMRRARRMPTTAASAVAEVAIDALGAQGDGVAVWGEKTLYVPGTAPGDRVRVSVGLKRGDGFEATVLELLAPSPGRVEPFCPYFGACGGCAVQHVTESAHADWKRGILVDALRRRGFGDAAVDPVITTPTRGRRRVTLTLDRRGGGVLLGFNARFSHRVVDVEECSVLVPELESLIVPLRRLVAEVGWTKGQVAIARSETGIDVLFTAPEPPSLEARERLAAFADAHDIARLSWRSADVSAPQPLAWRRHVRMTFGGVPVDLPPGAFLQPSEAGEQALTDLVLQGTEGAKRVADLYCGIGTFALPLSRKAVVRAVDNVPSAISSLETAAGRASRGGRVMAEVRDLDRRPLMADDLKDIEAVVFDPPRMGAKAQSETLAKIPGVTRIVAVSCNPATLARDLRILVDGGFGLRRVVPVDQFPHAPHVEAVAFLSR